MHSRQRCGSGKRFNGLLGAVGSSLYPRVDPSSKYLARNGKENRWLTRHSKTGGSKQKGIVHWGLSANRQNPFAGALYDAFFNTFRRTKSQIFYWAPVLAGGYWLMHWATER